MKSPITGTAGFIGSLLALSLIERWYDTIDNDYYDQSVKYGRLERAGITQDVLEYNRLITSSKFPNYQFIELNMEDKDTKFVDWYLEFFNTKGQA